jgi:hypothetical protein
MRDLPYKAASISAYSAWRNARSETDRHGIAAQFAKEANLPDLPSGLFWSDADINAMKAAYIARFDEDLPRTETLMKVAAVGYRIALRDAQAGVTRMGGDACGSGPKD